MSDTTALFANYLKTVNEALNGKSDEFPYEQLIDAGTKLLEDKEIGVEIYKDDAATPHDRFTVSFKGGTFNLLEHGKGNPDTTWKLPQDHMAKVVDNPQSYIENPSRLDLDWMKERLGVGA